MYKENTHGFTLIEIMMVSVIIGVLATAAYPSYSRFLLKSHRTDALTTLLQDQIALERCYAEHHSYSKTCYYLPHFPQKTPQGFYHINLTSTNATRYTLTATPIEGQTRDRICAKFSIDQANMKRAEDAFGTVQNNCWNSL
jgi:type IV pilus assembly protein PilE